MGLFILTKDNSVLSLLKASKQNLELNKKLFSSNYLLDDFSLKYLTEAISQLENEVLYMEHSAISFLKEHGFDFEMTEQLKEIISELSSEERIKLAKYLNACYTVEDYRGLERCKKYLNDSFVAPEIKESLTEAIQLYEEALEKCKEKEKHE